MIAIHAKGSLSSTLDELKDTLRSPDLLLAGARGVTRFLRDHFNQLDTSRPNRRGWHRTHFWSKVGDTVSEPVVAGNDLTIHIAHVAIRQKIHGGPIYPRNAQYLTIPATDEAYGRRAREFAGLKFGYAWDSEALRERRALVRKEGDKVTPLFWLVRQVRQLPTPGTMPSDKKIQEAATTAANEWLTAHSENK